MAAAALVVLSCDVLLLTLLILTTKFARAYFQLVTIHGLSSGLEGQTKKVLVLLSVVRGDLLLVLCQAFVAASTSVARTWARARYLRVGKLTARIAAVGVDADLRQTRWIVVPHTARMTATILRVLDGDLLGTIWKDFARLVACLAMDRVVEQ